MQVLRFSRKLSMRTRSFNHQNKTRATESPSHAESGRDLFDIAIDHYPNCFKDKAGPGFEWRSKGVSALLLPSAYP